MSLIARFILPALALGLVLIAIGLRGRKTAPCRRCRKCGYDLSHADTHDRCTECGRDLTPYRAVIYSDRRRFGPLILLGLLLLMIASIYPGMHLARHLERVDWQNHKPAAWLVFEAKRSDNAAADAALNELHHRVATGALSQKRITELAQYAFEMQADEHVAWNEQWGAFFETAISMDLLPSQDIEEYLENAIFFDVAISDAGGPGRSDPFRLSNRGLKPSPPPASTLTVPQFSLLDIDLKLVSHRRAAPSTFVIDAQLQSVTIGPWQSLDVKAQPKVTFEDTIRYAGQQRNHNRSMYRVPVDVQPGSHEVVSNWTIAVRHEGQSPDQAIVREFTFSAPLTVEEAEPHAVPFATSQADTDTLRQAMQMRAIGFRTFELRQKPAQVTVIYLHLDTGANQITGDPQKPLAPFNGSIKLEVHCANDLIGKIGTHLPAGWAPIIVESDEIDTIDVQVRYSQSGYTVTVSSGGMFSDAKPQPLWMGPPFEIRNISVVWYDTVDDTPLTDDEREYIYMHAPRFRP